VLIGGIWKTGKTDFALYISEVLLKLGIIREVSSNIYTEGYYPQITDLVSLREWLYASNRRKLFILDEANVHLPSRRAMSGKNVEIVRLLGEVSKAHARIIIIAQELLRVDKEFLNPTWVRGVFIKKTLKKAHLISDLLPKEFVFKNIPPTTIPFDPYAVAPFTEKPTTPTLQFKDRQLNLLWDYAQGMHKSEIERRENIHRKQFDRILLRYLQKTLPMFLEIEIDDGSDAVRACALYYKGLNFAEIQRTFDLSHPELARRLVIRGIGELLKRSDSIHLVLSKRKK